MWINRLLYHVFWIVALAFAPVWAKSRQIYIYNWAHYVPEVVVQRFEQETGIKVIYDTFDSAEVLEARLLLNSGYDVVFPPAWPTYGRCVKLGLFQPLHREWIPNARGLDPKVLDKLSALDLSYGLPYMWGTTGIGYRRNALIKRVPEAPLNSWALLFDPKVASRLSAERLCVLDSAVDVFQSVLLYLGENPTTQDPAIWDKAINAFARVAPLIAEFEGSRQTENLVDGQSIALQGFSSYCNIAKMRGAPGDIEYIIPQEGAMLWFDMMAIPKDAPHVRDAHIFINFLLRPDIMATITNIMPAANPVPASLPMIKPEIRANNTIFPDEQTFARLHPDFFPNASLLRYLLRQWMKIKMGYLHPQDKESLDLLPDKE